MAAASPIAQLTDDLLAIIFHFVSRSDGQFQHALVCKKWHRIARRVHDHIQICENRRMRPRELLAHLSSFPRLRKLVLANGSLTSVPDSLLSRIADACPDLTDLCVDTMARQYRRGGFTENGLSFFFERCTRLEGLHLDCQSNLTTIPASIGGLASLKSLHIKDRGRIALIPDAFTSLQSLTHLVLELCCLDELPQGFGNLTLLKSLQLNRCMGLGSIPDSFGQLTNLTHLSISGSAASLQLPESTSNLSSLLTLEISNCKDLAPLPESFGNLPALETLRLEEVGGITNLPASLVHLQRLRLLSVINCYKLVSIPTPLSHLTSLTDLILVGQALDLLPLDIGPLPHLRTLKLDGIRVHLPPSITLATAMKELTLHDFRVICSLPEEFGQLTALATLHLMKLPRLTSLPSSLGDVTSLKELKISECSQLAQLPHSLTLLSSLELLEISHCCNLTALPQGMGNGLHSLRRLFLRECAALTCLPPSFSSLSSLETLEIHQATSLGALPDGFSHLTSLRKLALCFLPHLPALLASLPAIAHSLTSLELLSCTQISALPEEIGWLGGLETLELYELPKLKSLPRSLCQLQRLKYLQVRNCSALQLLFGDEDLGVVPYGYGLGAGSTRLEFAGHTGCSSAAGSSGGSEGKDKSVLLPSLESLEISGPPLQLLGPSLGCFPSLTALKISAMHWLRALPPPDSLACSHSRSDLSLMSLPKLRSLPETFSQLPRLEGLTLLGCKRLARLPTGLRQMGKLQACVITDCRLLSKRQKMVICGTANLDEGERVVGGSEEEDEGEVWMGEEDEGSERGESEGEEGEGTLPLQRLGASLGSFLSLTKLEILEMHRITSLPASISRLSLLQSLTVSHAKGLLSLPETLGGLPALTTLQLDNLLSLSKLPESFGQLNMIQYLEIYRSPGLTKLPDSFPGLCRLELCYISRIGISCLPDDFCKLQDLHLHSCEQLVRLPTGLQQMAKLHACTVTECPLLSTGQRVVICGSADLDEGEHVVGGVEQEDGGGMARRCKRNYEIADFTHFAAGTPGCAELASLDATLSDFRANPGQVSQVFCFTWAVVLEKSATAA
ncbi:unnamed protein product [Closterium sp. Yama58-4]|nr:unnamed protein product [Closterium sp. Yama58-4]